MGKVKKLRSAIEQAGFTAFTNSLQRQADSAIKDSFMETYMHECIGRSNTAINDVTTQLKKKNRNKTTAESLSDVSRNFISVIEHLDFAKKPFLNNKDRRSLEIIKGLRRNLVDILEKQQIEIFPQIDDIFNEKRHIISETVNAQDKKYKRYTQITKPTIVEVWKAGISVKGKDERKAYVSVIMPPQP